jgi:hypothetical protein
MSAERKTIEVDADLLYSLLDIVAYPPERGGTHVYAAKVPWRWVNEARALLDANGVGPHVRYDWRKAHGMQSDNRARNAERYEAERATQ